MNVSIVTRAACSLSESVLLKSNPKNFYKVLRFLLSYCTVVDTDIVNLAGEETLPLFSFFPFFNRIRKRLSINLQESGFYIELSIKLLNLSSP